MPRESAQQRDAREHFEAMAARRLKRLAKLKAELAKRTHVDSQEDLIAAEEARFGADQAAAAAAIAATGRASDTAAPDRRFGSVSPDTPIPGTVPPERPGEHYLVHQARELASIGFTEIGGFQNRPTERDIYRDQQAAANRERILKKFHGMQYAGELLPNGKIWYDCVEYSPEQWEGRMQSEGR